ncbi:hypothetical protein AB6A40_009417 [Gnathostoma spinigerum]|uniref:aECM cysteine-cradle domain-containing protein n=1 Tax=Gnathostoma spinigerum TaxID=75299 RepID=A0ABD6EZV2_9BILA
MTKTSQLFSKNSKTDKSEIDRNRDMIEEFQTEMMSHADRLLQEKDSMNEMKSDEDNGESVIEKEIRESAKIMSSEEREKHEKTVEHEKELLAKARRLRMEQEKVMAQKQHLSSSEIEQTSERMKQLEDAEKKLMELIARQVISHRTQTESPIKVISANADTSLKKLADSAHSNVVRIHLSDTQCDTVRKFVSVFDMKNPSEWVKENCSFAQKFFPRSTCEQIKHLFKSCF